MNTRHIVFAFAIIGSILFSGQAHAAYASQARSVVRFVKIASGISIPLMTISWVNSLKNSDKKSMLELPDASPFYRRHFDEALRAYGISNPEKIALKNNSSLPTDTYGISSSAGTQLDEKQLDKCIMAERIQTCYHEAAHIALRHPDAYLKNLVAYSACVSCSILTSNNLQKAFAIGAGVWTLNLVQKVFCPWLNMPTEREADAMTMEHLIKNGKYYIIEKISYQYEDEYNQYKDALDKLSNDDLSLDQWLARLEAKETMQQSLERLTRWKMLSEKAYAKVRREHLIKAKL